MKYLSKILKQSTIKKLTTDNWLFFLLIVSSVIGPGLSYKSVYIFHVILLITIVYEFFIKKGNIKKVITDLLSSDKGMSYFIFFTIIYFLIKIPFTENISYALKYFVFMTIGFSLTLYVVFKVQKTEDFKFLFRSIAIVYLIDLLIGTLEMFNLIRWPISRLSSLNHWFGRQVEVEQIVEEAVSASYVYTMPTGFHWNPNNFATFMLMGLPFFLLHKRLWVSIIGVVLILLLIVAAGSKIAFLGAFIVLLFSFFFIKDKLKNITVLLVSLFFLSTNGFHTLNGKYEKLDEIQSLIYGKIGWEVENKDSEVMKTNQSSEGYRVELIKEGIKLFKQNPIFGVGGGNAQYFIEEKGGVGEKKVCNLHNFWLELLVEGGLFFFIVFVAWFSKLIIKLLKFSFKVKADREIKYILYSTLLSTASFVFSGIGPSSMIGYLPLYLFLGVALSLSFLYNKLQKN